MDMTSHAIFLFTHSTVHIYTLYTVYALKIFTLTFYDNVQLMNLLRSINQIA